MDRWTLMIYVAGLAAIGGIVGLVQYYDSPRYSYRPRYYQETPDMPLPSYDPYKQRPTMPLPRARRICWFGQDNLQHCQWIYE